jgi:N-acetylglucosamine kinase-like BadF-type ATPase
VTRRAAILAVDGGGSKTDAVLLRRDGTILGAARTPTKEFDQHGGDAHMRQIMDAVVAACLDADLDPDRRPVADLGVYCLAGADLPIDDRRILRWLRRIGVTRENLVHNDTFAVLRAGADQTWGVGIVCGFGTNCSAVAPSGRTYRLPALGEVSGDWGGAGDLGRAALWHALRASDGRGPRTAFSRLVPARFGLRRPREVMEALYFGTLAPDQLAELAPTVFRAARDGDGVAQSLVDRQADEVAIMATAAIRRLGMRALPVPVVLGGGIFRTDDRAFFERIHAGIHAVAPDAVVTVLTDPPVIGAAHLGLDRSKATGAAHGRVAAALTHARLSAHTHHRKKEPVHGADHP